jgi:small-conductance mechanosensitive channel
MLSLALSGSIPARAQDASSRDAEGNPRLALVVIDGRTLFAVRGVTAHPAERRAAEIADRIRAVAANRGIAVQSLTLERETAATWILAGGTRIMGVLEEDAAIEQTARDSLAQVCRIRIMEAIESYRRERSAAFLWMRTLYALAATVLLLVSALGGRRLVVLLRSRLERRYRTRIEGLQDRALQVVKADQIWRALTGSLNLLWGVSLAVMVYAYLNYSLALFPWTRLLARNLFSLAIDPLRTIWLGLLGAIPSLVFLAVLAFVTRGGLHVLHIVFDGIASGTVALKGFDAEWAGPTYRLVRLLIIAFALVVAYPYIPGSGSAAFKGVSLFMGIIFSLGSSSMIGNIIAGYTMTYRRAFKPGDLVRIGASIGKVEEMRLLVTHLRTPKNEEVVVPNSTILGSEIVNYSSLARERGLILHTTVGIGYETPWRQVEAMLLEAASRTPGLRREPPPFVLQTALGDFCVTYEINVSCDTPHSMPLLYTELHRNILDVFNEYGVQIMTPAYETDPEQAKIVPKEQWYAAPARATQARTADPSR